MSTTRRETRLETLFRASGDDGNTYTVLVLREWIRAQFQDNNTWSNETPGARTYYLRDGQLVHIKRDGTFRIDGTTIDLTPEGRTA
jgi:membrane protein involved in colicin uptake